MVARASLLEDGGAAGSSRTEFFRSPGFLGAEGVTHSLVIEGESWTEALPLIVRGIEGSERLDATSPYGYPGAAHPPERPPSTDRIDFSAVGLVTIFVRDRVDGRVCLEGGTERSRVRIADPRLKSGVRKRLREQIRRNERRGWAVSVTPGPETEESQRAAFRCAYGETMARADAARRYLFDDSYFRGVLSEGCAWLLLAHQGGDATAGAIAVESDGHLHYFLGGTGDEALRDSPMKNLFAAMIELSADRGLALNLGGGVVPGDSLDDFKRGFANAEASFRSHELVCDARAYRELVGASAPAPKGFFPPYRAPYRA